MEVRYAGIGEPSNERIIRVPDVYRTLFHWILVKILGYDGA